MVLDIGEKTVDKNMEEQANKEYRELLEKRTQMVIKRRKELKEEFGLTKVLDGPSRYQDIDDWFNEKFNDIKKKYGIN